MWDQILGHQAVLERFRRSVDRNRLASTYLFVGPPGIGKRQFALRLAQSLLCETNPESDLEACGTCPSCQQTAAQTHPDLILISKPEDKAIIPVETFIGDKEHRRQEGLCHDIGLKPFRGGRKVAIIDDADYLNQESANSLLKTLEEPPPRSVLILLGTSEQRQLPTIVSRSQVIRFEPLTNSDVLSILEKNELVESDEIPLADLAAASGGSVETAVKLSDPETFEFRRVLFRQLASRDPGQRDFAKTVSGFVDSAGKDASKKRLRLVMIGDFSITFYRQCYLQLANAEGDDGRSDPSLTPQVADAMAPWLDDVNTGAEVAAQCIWRCTDMQRQVLANVGAQNVIEAWLRDLGRICRMEACPQ